MDDQFQRTELILGAKSTARLKRCRVAVFGLGGVGGSATEALARSGIGTLDIFDNDKVDISNLNRQIIATVDSLGMNKVDAMEARIRSIRRDILVKKHDVFHVPDDYVPKSGIALPDNASSAIPELACFDYIVDAIDNVTAKLDIICRANEAGIPVISAMGTGNRIDPSKLEVMDVYKTKNDPLARVMRRELKARKIKNLDVVCSTEIPIKPDFYMADKMKEAGFPPPGSTPFVPGAAGLLIASFVVRRLLHTL